jgi:hypothetical protein
MVDAVAEIAVLLLAISMHLEDDHARGVRFSGETSMCTDFVALISEEGSSGWWEVARRRILR